MTTLTDAALEKALFAHQIALMRNRAARFGLSEGYEGVTHAGIAVVAADTGRVLLAQRAYDETDDESTRETWEFPGGHLEPGEEPFAAASREFSEEIGIPLPEGEVINGWRAGENSETGHYQGFVYQIPTTFAIDTWQPTSEVQAIAWMDSAAVDTEEAHGRMRPEIVATMDWTLVFPETEEGVMTKALVAATQVGTADEYLQVDEDGNTVEPELSLADLALDAIPVHGILAPEDVETGDGRGFNSGSMTARPYRLPFAWQKVSVPGHDGSFVVGSVDRLMRKDGLIHWEGALMPSADAGEFAEYLAFFGRVGVSVDGDKGSMDKAKTDATGVLWFDAVRAAGLTAVAIPAFAEAYVAFGPHPEMPEEDDEEFAVLRASGDMVTFDRGPGWATHPAETKRIHDYWTKKGQPGYAKIGWGTRGDFTRAKKLIGQKIGANSPEDLKYLNQIIAQWHYDALGYWPGDLDMPGNKTSAEARAERKMSASAGDGPAWEAVLVSSAGPKAGQRVLPPASYFKKHPDSGALVIEEPDENGLRRTYGYAGEWGVCHIGYGNKCVNVPEDPTGSDYAEFHLGRTKVAAEDGGTGYINTGLITYGVEHRDADTILSESPTQAHFDDLSRAWAAVVVGEDDRGIWFSGVVLPTVEEKWITTIEASGQVSGEWKWGAMRTLLTVNVPGFPVMRSSAAYDDEGNLVALVASALKASYEVAEPPENATCAYGECGAAATWGVWESPDVPTLYCAEHAALVDPQHECAETEPTPLERMQALAAIEAETRLAALREQFMGQGVS